MTKRILSIVFALIMALSVFSILGFALEKTENGITYMAINWGEDDDFSSWMLISVNPATVSENLVIPDKIEEKPVSDIKENAFNGTNAVKSVQIPSSVINVKAEAFKGCPALATVTFAPSESSVTLGKGAFQNCTKLKTLNFPTQISTIPEECFSGCKGLSMVYIPNTVTEIGINAFRDTAISEIEIPINCAIIGEGAFAKCPALKYFVVNEYNTHFKAVDGVLFTADGKTLVQYPNGKENTHYTVPNGVTEISPFAFAYSTNLETVTLPSSVKEIGNSAFEKCTALTSIQLQRGLETIGENAFTDCGNLNTVTIPSTVTNFTAAFLNSGLKSVTIENGVTTISERSFEECRNLTDITVPASVTKVELNAFYNTALATVTFAPSESSVTLGRGAFKNCTKLKTLNFPTQISTIPEECFSGCKGLSMVYIPNTVTEIGINAFRDTAISEIEIPINCAIIGEGAFAKCPALKYFVVNEYNTHFKAVDGVLFTADGKTLVQYPNGKENTHYTVPNGVTEISPFAFAYSTNLETVTLPSSVKEIGNSAFEKCTALTSIQLQRGLETIGENAFTDCGNLNTVTIPSTVTNFTAAFLNSGLKSVTIENGVTTISERSFEECRNLTDITVPASVTKVELNAFYNTALQNITYNGSLQMAQAMVIEAGNNGFNPVNDSLASYNFVNPSRTSLTYKQAIILHLESGKPIPAGYRVEWSQNGGAFTLSDKTDTKCKATASSTGSTTVTVKVFNNENFEIYSAQKVLNADCSFWQKIIAFFRGIFGKHAIYDNY